MSRKVPEGKETRSRKVSLSLAPSIHDAIKELADEMGLSVSAWSAFTLAQAVRSHKDLRSRMSDEMVSLLSAALKEEADNAKGSDEPPKK